MELKVQSRTILGKKVKTLREEDLIPAELYGHGVKNLHFTLSAKEFQKVFKEAGESTIINLITEDNKTLPVMIHDLEIDPLSKKILNVDFYQIKMSEKIRVPVSIEFSGEAPAVKTLGGILVKTLQEIEVEALPSDLPNRIEVDLSGLDEIGKSISVKDLKISEKVKIFVNPDTIIATVVEAKAEEVVAEAAPAEEVAPETQAPAEGEASP
jgi:large subunit ribosomal protein L25